MRPETRIAKGENTMDDEERARRASRVTWYGFVLNIALTLLKLIFGLIGRSSALFADGIHSASDIITDLGVLIGFTYVKRPIDEDHRYGHGKVETLISSLIGLILIGVAAGILFNGFRSIIGVMNGEELGRPGPLLIIVAAFSILSKEWIFQLTRRVARKIDSKALMANAWHHRTDSLSSIATFLGILGAFLLGGSWKILDPAASVIVSLFIFRVGLIILRESVEELMEKSLKPRDLKRIQRCVTSVEGVKDMHGLRTRKIGSKKAVEMHIEVNPELNVVASHDIATEVEESIRAELGDSTFVSVHVEPHSATGSADQRSL